MKVLAVDDLAENLCFMMNLLEGAGYGAVNAGQSP